MKILITGGNGQLGKALAEVLKNEEILLTDTDNMEITDPTQIERVFTDFEPDFLVHGAAITNVDGCEENPDLANKVNAGGTRNLVNACKKAGISMIYISTDYVFDGTATEPIPEDTKTNPLSAYGKSKLDGETAVLALQNGYVLRTSWVYGEGNNFVRTMLALSEKMNEIKVVNDQYGRPTYAPDLARAIYNVVQKHSTPGIYNVTGDGQIISWADFATEIFTIAGKKTKVVGITTEEYLSDKKDHTIAPRPMYSALDLTKSKASDLFLSDWKAPLAKYLQN
ncbi:MAG: dTDP-4-dehydrorhamnose reductase [bacterium]